jgi:hypothetical protein
MITSRRRFLELLGVGAGAGALVGCQAVTDALSPSNVQVVVAAVGDIGKAASYFNLIVSGVEAAATFLGVTIPAKVQTALADITSTVANLTPNGSVATIQTAVSTGLTDVEAVITGFAGNASGDLEAALNDAAQLVPEIASAVGLVVSAATPSAARRRAGATVPVTVVLADLHRIAALKK